MSSKRTRSNRRLRRAIFGAPGQPAAYIEEVAGVFHVYVGRKDCGTTASEEAAVALAKKINDGGADGR